MSFVPVVYAQIQDWTAYQCTVAGVKTTCDCTVNGVPTLKCLEIVIGNILFISSSLVIIILFFMFVIGSIKYLTSGGEKEKLAEAQKTLKYALIGFFLFLASYMILNVIDTLFLGGTKTIFKFEIPDFK